MDSLQMGVHLGVWQKVRVTVVLAIAFSSEHAGTVRLENLEDPCRAAPEDKQQGMSIVCYRSCRHHAAVGHVSGCREEPADQPLPAGDSVHVAGPGDGEGMLSRLQQQTCPSLGAARTLGASHHGSHGMRAGTVQPFCRHHRQHVQQAAPGGHWHGAVGHHGPWHGLLP